MNHKKIIRLLLILGPALLLTVQLFLEPVYQRPKRIQTAMKALVPPLSFVFHYIDFNQKNSLSKWEDKLFQGKVAYWLEFDKKTGYVHAKSKQAASAIFYKIKYNLQEYPFISWKWKVLKFPNKAKAVDDKTRDDFAARFYVVFLSKFFTNFKCVEYVWDESLPEGTVLTSPYSDQIKQIVVQSGKSSEWVSESQNVLEDYQKLFGEKPKGKVSALALMTDSEGTKDEAEALFDDIRIGKSK